MTTTEERVLLHVEVPICAFRPSASREYQDTYPVPTPASIYGMLLSMLGVPREEKARHRGCELAIGLESVPAQSRVFRKLRRGANLASLRPDYQDLLLDVRFWCWVRRGREKVEASLAERLRTTLDDPSSIRRSGGLSLGESSYLVNDVSRRENPPDRLTFVRPRPDGFYALPCWVDHGDAERTTLIRCSLETLPLDSALDVCWIEI